MKQFVLLVIILSSAFSLTAQTDEGDWNISLSRRYPVSNNNRNQVLLTGVDVEYMALDNFSINYNVYGGRGIFHMPGGIAVAAGVAAIMSYGGEADAEILLYSLAIPEGIAYNFKIVNNLYFTPYFNPLGLELNFFPDEEFRAFFTGSTGVKFKAIIPNANFWVNGENYNLFMSAYAEGQLEYTKGSEPTARSGFGLGVAF